MMKDYNNYDEYKEGFNEDYFYDEELEYKRNRRKLRLFKVISTLTLIIFAMVAIFIAFPGINKDKEEKIMEDYKKVKDVLCREKYRLYTNKYVCSQIW